MSLGGDFAAVVSTESHLEMLRNWRKIKRGKNPGRGNLVQSVFLKTQPI